MSVISKSTTKSRRHKNQSKFFSRQIRFPVETYPKIRKHSARKNLIFYSAMFLIFPESFRGKSYLRSKSVLPFSFQELTNARYIGPVFIFYVYVKKENAFSRLGLIFVFWCATIARSDLINLLTYEDSTYFSTIKPYEKVFDFYKIATVNEMACFPFATLT